MYNHKGGELKKNFSMMFVSAIEKKGKAKSGKGFRFDVDIMDEDKLVLKAATEEAADRWVAALEDWRDYFLLHMNG